MKSAKQMATALLVGMFTFSAVGCSMVEKRPDVVNAKVVATIYGDQNITRGDIDNLSKGVVAQLKTQYGDSYDKNEEAVSALKKEKEQILTSLIDQKIFLKKAKDKKITLTKDEMKTNVDDVYNQYKQQYKTESEFKSQLSQYGYTVAQFKEQLKNRAICDKLIQQVVKDAKVSDEEAQKYYDSHKNSYTQSPNTIHLAHILVKTESEAKKAKARIDKGEDFGAVAKAVSTDGSKDKGGDLGDIQENDSNYDKTFMKAALKLKDNEVSSPVHTQFGWHVIKCIKRTQYPPKDFNSVKDEIKQTLLNTKQKNLYQKTLKKWESEANIQKNEKNLM
ncbi:peptidylprolyl isomerase [Clostridium felsineum]|uniref:Foldase protein PrsA n=1 Tax=Clostridium felsineum TaxID=36839 RepID=A0A1S8LR93_9CLOT|nr:peptidylprolyl isomerase [Clostridium felsineum]MCR3760800.1 peptidylprolyl isomerase [Clostridium felsineum]URZ03378.1 Foldase protein PrsA [Clostridium felsineum]URZ08304.1 Foldase protein PrsA [Clostridium felsineum]URZ13335.1 Foldase protein PrsA [Clostridium felsineum]URZ14684.1 Foldase protein PrsA [Clostridium felsineum DSM 794]